MSVLHINNKVHLKGICKAIGIPGIHSKLLTEVQHSLNSSLDEEEIVFMLHKSKVFIF